MNGIQDLMGVKPFKVTEARIFCINEMFNA